MRIPLRKIYRAFPELDRFDDELCERFVIQATRVAVGRRMRRHVIEAAVGGAVFVLLLAAGFVTVRMVGPQLLSPPLAPIFVLTYFPLLVAIPIVCSLVARDWWLRRAVAARLKCARCPGCDYSLLGLRVAGDLVVCPECGREIDLARHGLTPADVLGCAEPAAMEVQPSSVRLS